MSHGADQRLPRLSAVGQRYPRLLDGGIVLGLLAIGFAPALAGREGDAGLLFTTLLVVPLLLRRRHPVAVFSALAVLALVHWSLDLRAFGDVALLFALYSVAATQPVKRTLIAAGVLEFGILLATVRWAGTDPAPAFVGLSGLATAAAVLGTNARNRAALLASLEERAARLEFERDQQGRLSAAAERSRIAREMHDIVAHNLSVMIALADGASYAVRETPGQAAAAMRNCSRTGRQALTEMRRLLGVLREEPGAAERSPQPGIAQVDALVEQIRSAGVPVRYESAGDPGTLSQGLELAAYRIVQEALTNTLKHAGPGARAEVTLSYAGDRLDVEVRDSGGPASPAADDGRGLSGMRERAAVYDGVVEAGPMPDGGWRVRTQLVAAAPPAVPMPAHA